MDEFADPVAHSSSDDLGVKEETNPINPRPPTTSENAEKLPDAVLSDVDMDELQSGVRKQEPAAPTR
eukprot:2694503-Heterocapsa_arctica.AAC.1